MDFFGGFVVLVGDVGYVLRLVVNVLVTLLPVLFELFVFQFHML